MSLSSNVGALATRIGQEFKALRTLINGNAADLSALTTTAKGNLVAAINEVKASVAAASSINDSATTTTSTWSSSKINTSLSGKADLVGGLVPTAQLPPLAINETFTVASQTAMLALTAQRGDIAIRTDNGRTYVLSTDAQATLADWKEVLASGQVQSVAGKTGVVSLVKADVGLGSVDNTSDLAKPISTATQTALNAKIDSTDVGPTETDYVALLNAELV